MPLTAVMGGYHTSSIFEIVFYYFRYYSNHDKRKIDLTDASCLIFLLKKIKTKIEFIKIQVQLSMPGKQQH